MTPNNQVSMSTFGYRFGGGRTSQFEVLGETYATKPAVTVNGGQFSTVNKKAVFTLPQTMDRMKAEPSKSTEM